MTEAFLLSAVCASSSGLVQTEGEMLDWTAMVVRETARRGGVQIPRIGLLLWSGTGEAAQFSTRQIRQGSGYPGPVVSVLAGRASSQYGLTWGVQAVESNQQDLVLVGGLHVGPLLTEGETLTDKSQQANMYRAESQERSRRAVSEGWLKAVQFSFPGSLDNKLSASRSTTGAAGLLLASARAVGRDNLLPRATIITTALSVGASAGTTATQKALKQAGLGIDDLDCLTIDETHPSQLVAWADSMGSDLDKVNLSGPPLAYGAVEGALGAGMLAILITDLERIKGRYGLQLIDSQDGTAIATIIERV